jgi:hypothetical protein
VRFQRAALATENQPRLIDPRAFQRYPVRAIALLLALQLPAPPHAATPICGTATPWPPSFSAQYDSVSDVAYATPSTVTFPMAKADGNVQYNMQMLASHPHRTSADSARVELRFWMHTLLEPGAIARAIISVPDTVAVRVTLPDSTKLAWLVIAKRPWGQREQSAVSSVTEDMFVQAPPDGLARFVSAPGAALDIRGRHLHLNADQLAEWRGIVRWAWCPDERYRR